MQALRDILDHWPDAWRYPELMAMLVRAGVEIDPGALAKGVIDGIASPRPPQEALVSLLRAGEFQAAARVMETQEFRAAIEASDYAVLSRALDDARREALEEIHARAAALEARARRVGLKNVEPTGIDAAVNERAADAGALLDRSEHEILREEANVSERLRQRLDEVLGETHDEPSPGIAVWKGSVERCLEAREYEAARFLFEAGPTAAAPDEPMMVPRRPRWPWEEPPEEVVQWLQGTRPAPPEFYARWRYDPDDKPAARLVELLGYISSAGIPDDATAREVADALDSFLGHEVSGREVAVQGDWFLTRLHAPVDARLPCMGALGSYGVRLWLPRTANAAPPDESVGDETTICFQLGAGTSCPPRSIRFDVWTLLRLLADRQHRRVNFLRELGSEVDLETAIPAQLEGLELPSTDPAAVRIYAAWVLDVVDVEVADPAAFDVIVYYGGAQPRLILRLMRALLGAASSRRSAIRYDDVRRVWQMPSFRKAACSDLLDPIAGDPSLRAVLGAALFAAARPGGSLTAEDVCLALAEFWATEIKESDAAAKLNRLADQQLIEVASAPGEYRVPASGIGSLLIEGVADVEDYIAQALQDLQNAGR